MAPCCDAPTVHVGSDGQPFGVIPGEFQLGPHVTASSLAGSLVGQYLANSIMSRGFSYSSDGIVASDFS